MGMELVPEMIGSEVIWGTWVRWGAVFLAYPFDERRVVVIVEADQCGVVDTAVADVSHSRAAKHD